MNEAYSEDPASHHRGFPKAARQQEQQQDAQHRGCLRQQESKRDVKKGQSEQLREGLSLGVDTGVCSYVHERLRALRGSISDDESLALFDEEIAQRLPPLNDSTGWDPEGEEAALIPGEEMLDLLDFFSDVYGDSAPISDGT